MDLREAIDKVGSSLDTTENILEVVLDRYLIDDPMGSVDAAQDLIAHWKLYVSLLEVAHKEIRQANQILVDSTRVLARRKSEV